MSTVQERNSEMVEILSSDFVKRKDSTYQSGALAGAIMALPGIVSFWPMGVAIEESTVLFADQIIVGASYAPTANLEVLRGNYANGTAIFRGTSYSSYLNYSALEDTYIRGGLSSSKVLIADVNGGGADICSGGGPTVFGGRIGSTFTGFSFGSGWTNYGGYSLGSYKKIGDMVFLRGLVQRTSGVGLLIGVLPVGFRPAAPELLDVITDSGQGRVDISSTGDITLVSGGTAWVAFTGQNFSTL